MKKFTADVIVNKQKSGRQLESPHIYSCVNDAFKAAQAALYQQHRQPGNTGNWWSVGLKEVEGDTVNHRCSHCTEVRDESSREGSLQGSDGGSESRPILVKQQEQAELERRQDEQTAQLRKARCKRIMHQIDHAFKTGESGSEPVAKYVTCQHCDLPAGFLYLNVALAPGAAVMDETTITDAVHVVTTMALVPGITARTTTGTLRRLFPVRGWNSSTRASGRLPSNRRNHECCIGQDRTLLRCCRIRGGPVCFLNLTRIEDNVMTATMAVDGTHLFFNPEFTMALSDKECIGVLMHETAHCALLHITRRKYRAATLEHCV